MDNFEEAVRIDTIFAEAYAELARAHARLIFLREDLPESRLAKADQAAKKALQYGFKIIATEDTEPAEKI